MAKILVVEDDIELNKSVCVYLDDCGYEVFGCTDANSAYDVLYENTVDLIVTDIMMPVTDGFEFTKTVREINKDIPIIFVTAREDFFSKKIGYGVGADDYMVKPIELEELQLRIGALLRRAKIVSSKKLEIGKLIMDSEEHSAYYDGCEIPLTVREFNLIFKLLSYPKKAFTRSKLMEEFWGIDSNSGTRTVDVYITKLREKFSMCEEFEIITVHGLGYKAVIKDEK